VKNARIRLTQCDLDSRAALTPRRFDVPTEHREQREEVMTMNFWRKGLAALAVTGALVGGYSAVAYAQTSDPSTTQTQQGDSSQTTTPGDAAPAPAQGGGSANCPNM
jgi:hypothetical protein